MAQYGQGDLKRGDKGEAVQELQIRLAGFRGTIPDGDFGPGTELQVATFQKDVMQMTTPTGIADNATFAAISQFARKYPIKFNEIKCPCGQCDGFGNGLFKGQYISGQPQMEAFYMYEYPGIHRMILWATRALFHYRQDYNFFFSSGYRCSENNKQHGRSTTNHCGKAVDLDVSLKPGESKMDDMKRCDEIRGLLVEKSNAQIGWAANNRKALEPSSIAPTWVHYDVRCYQPQFLEDRFFCKNEHELDGI